MFQHCGLSFDKDLGVYVGKNHGVNSFTYADGSETYLLSVLDKVQDKSSLSRELQQHVRDWASLYHLSLERANLLRCFEFYGGGKASVLELGAGCGAITRYLGEQFGLVWAVEGSLARCKCIRKRCVDLDNVRVICGNFFDIPWENIEEKFDLVTLIGVLEYGSLYFSPPSDAASSTLRLAHEVLKENGLLIIAIENKFGVKYWSGCHEDHTGIVFESLQGYPSRKGPTTYGRQELEDLLRRSGFGWVDWYLPFPDYKLPDVIINAQIPELGNRYFVYNWIETPFQDRGFTKRLLLFNESLVVRELSRNNLLPELANSFLVLAYKGNPKEVSKFLGLSGSWVAKKYTLRRAPCFRKCTMLVPGDPPKIIHQRIGEQFPRVCRYKSVVQKIGEEEFVPGDLALFSIFESIVRGDFERELLQTLRAVKDFILNNFSTGLEEEGYPLVSDQAFDVILSNVVKDVKSQELHFIDREWELAEPLPIDYILFRNLLHMYYRFASYLPIKGKPMEQWIIENIQQIFPQYDYRRLVHNMEREKHIATLVASADTEG